MIHVEIITFTYYRNVRSEINVIPDANMPGRSGLGQNLALFCPPPPLPPFKASGSTIKVDYFRQTAVRVLKPYPALFSTIRCIGAAGALSQIEVQNVIWVMPVVENLTAILFRYIFQS